MVPSDEFVAVDSSLQASSGPLQSATSRLYSKPGSCVPVAQVSRKRSAKLFADFAPDRWLSRKQHGRPWATFRVRRPNQSLVLSTPATAVEDNREDI